MPTLVTISYLSVTLYWLVDMLAPLSGTKVVGTTCIDTRNCFESQTMEIEQ